MGGGPRGSRGAYGDSHSGLVSRDVGAAVDGQGIDGRGYRVVPVFAMLDPNDESVGEVRVDAGRVEGSGTIGRGCTEEGVEGGAGGNLGTGVALLVGGRMPELA